MLDARFRNVLAKKAHELERLLIEQHKVGAERRHLLLFCAAVN